MGDLNCQNSEIFVLILLLLCYNTSAQIAVATAPSYAPIKTNCPLNQPLLRLAGSASQSNQTLSNGETDFVNGRSRVVSPLWRDFYTSGIGSRTGYSQSSLFSGDGQDDWPILGIAHSGGGQRAALYGAGVLQALDSRTSSSPVKGVLQLATYQSGLSGGSWLTTSWASGDNMPLDQLVTGWQLEKDLLFPGDLNVLRNGQYLDNLVDDTEKKKKAGYNVSITDVWGRAISHHFLPGTTSANFYTDSPETAHGAGILFSNLRNLNGMKNFQAPLPIIVSNNFIRGSTTTSDRSSVPISGRTYIPLSTTVYEFTPLEFGSFDPYLSAFTPTEYLGTNLNFGKPIGPSSCTIAFDQSSFVMGTSASLFNAPINGVLAGLDGQREVLIKSLLERLPIGDTVEEALTARYPNPFKGVNGQIKFDGSNLDQLSIVDGGENGENVPFNPLIAPARKVDVILAVDASADTQRGARFGQNWPNGTSIINTFLRVTRVLPIGSATFPPIPTDPKIWLSKGLSTRPTFFGCSPLTETGNGGFPLIIYVPNTPLPQSDYHTNTSTFKLRYSKDDSKSFLNAASLTITRSVIDSKVDEEWPTCLSCALIDRSRNRRRVPRTSICQSCFKRYCYTD
ncbi:lysophospholipase [Phakopsora pachyrhizi]|uniref:Lysophospholipase n=1 Tax=Phakopsora pachyrhizi TaxID=170000 RepID=A0AAV0BUL2_PHAPC|nr:lysophospholipase [Phakopsora pachyrhizi]CAH7689799.1 lysophospholipase [Phakopsora pachyrhizi]